MRVLFSLLLSATLVVPFAAGAQPARLRTAADLLSEPGGRAIASLREGAEIARGGSRGGFVAATVEGWLDTASVRTAARPPWGVIVKSTSALLRASAASTGPTVAQLPGGMGLELVRRQGAWVRVRRTGWVASRAVSAPAAATVAPAAQRPGARPAASGATRGGSTAATPPTSGETVPSATALPEGALMPARGIPLSAAPGGPALATLDSAATPMIPLARDNGWVKVRIEGWVPEADVMPADTALRSTLTAADLRADPEGTRGRRVRWDVEFLALRTADALRRDLAEGEKFMLVRGPGAETSLLYVTIPPSLVREVEGLPELARLTIVARVRTGRSTPSGVPVLDLQSIARR